MAAGLPIARPNSGINGSRLSMICGLRFAPACAHRLPATQRHQSKALSHGGMQGRPSNAPNGSLCLHRLLAVASLQGDATMSGPEPSFAQMVRIFDLRAHGLSAEAIALRLGLPVEQVRSVLNPPPKATP